MQNFIYRTELKIYRQLINAFFNCGGKIWLNRKYKNNIAERMGEIFRREVRKIKSEAILEVRGRGLLNAIVTRPVGGCTAWDICLRMKERGLLAKPTHDHIIRFAPPLTITEEAHMQAIAIIRETFEEI